MFVATRVKKSHQENPATACDPEKANACPLGALTTLSDE
jgi:hypothetical protein